MTARPPIGLHACGAPARRARARSGIIGRLSAALGFVLLVWLEPAVRADGSAPSDRETAPYTPGDMPAGQPTPSRGQKVYDAMILRPFGFVQTVVSAAVFVVFYPASVRTGTTDDLTEMCITGPVEQTFRRPLGES